MGKFEQTQPQAAIVIEALNFDGAKVEKFPVEKEQGTVSAIIYNAQDEKIAEQVQPLDSYLQGWLYTLFSNNSNAATAQPSIQSLDTGGTSRTHVGGSIGLAHNTTTSTDATVGVVVGTGSNPVVVTDHKLGGQCAHGSGTNQFMHQVQQFDTYVTVGTTTRFTSKRRFANSGSVSITVTEAGIYAQNTAGGTQKFCIIRDVLATASVVAVGQTIEVQYSLPITMVSTSGGYVGNFDKLFNNTAGNGLLIFSSDAVDINGTTRQLSGTNVPFNTIAAIGVVTQGIVVGTSSASVVISDNKLNSICTNGSGLNQLSYQAMAYDAPIVSGSVITVRQKRVVNNLGTGSVVIQEIGVYSLCNTSAGTQNFCISRHVVTPYTIPSSGSVQITFVQQISVP